MNLLKSLRQTEKRNLSENFQTISSSEKINLSDLKKNKVIYLPGAAKEWEAVKKWSLGYFEINYGDEEVLLINNQGVVAKNAPKEQEILTLRNFIQELKKGSLKYLKLSNLIQKNESLQKDVDNDFLKSLILPFSFGETYYSFIGGKNTITPLHNEMPLTIYIQIKGNKKWTIYPPQDRHFVGAYSNRTPYFVSDYNPMKEDLQNFPASPLAEKIEYDLKEGDILIVPPFYWHYVYNESDSIGMAFKYINLVSSLKSSLFLITLFFLSTKPSVFYSFFATRLKNDDYLLRKKS